MTKIKTFDEYIAIAKASLALLKHSRKGNMAIGYAIMGLVFAVIMAVVAVLVGGIFFQQTASIFTSQNITATNQSGWYNLYVSAGNYATTAIGIALVALVFVGIGVLLWAVLSFFGGGKTNNFGGGMWLRKVVMWRI